MTDPLTVVQLCAPDAVGGLERVVQALSIGLHRRGHRVIVAAVVDPGASDNPFFEPLLDASVPTEILEVPGRAYRRERRLLGDLYRKLRPDVVHSHGFRSDVLDLGVAHRAGIPGVTTLHGSSRMGGMSTVYEWLQLLSLRRFEAVVAVSGPLREQLAGTWAKPGRVHLVRNAWAHPDAELLPRADARAALGLDEAGPVVGWVGRLIEVKQADLFLSALARLHPTGPRAVIVGDGRMRPTLEARAKELGLLDRVSFSGSIFDVARLFGAFDVFVLSSRSEGTPVVLFEAMAAQVPIVATSVGGVPDLLAGDAAWLVKPGDPAALAEGIEAALTDRAEAEKRASRAHERLRTEFAVDPWLDAHERIYRAIRRR